MHVAQQRPPIPPPPGQRNAAQLRAAALATGTFANYVGDGASVPWQVGLPGNVFIAGTLLAYKIYLDGRWLSAFYLHDWCYTPWGKLASVTREEADAALYEEIAADSPFDAAVVYAAVRIGGAPYFGRSQTGYNGSEAQSAGFDIGLPPEPPNKQVFSSNPLRDFPMSTKIVMKFLGFTDKSPPIATGGGGLQEHGFSFTESFWSTDSIGTVTANLKFRTFQRRAALLPTQVSVLGATLYNNGSGAGTFVDNALPGVYPSLDQANVALLCRSNNPGAANQSRFWIHCLPDVFCNGGEYTPTPAYAADVQAYFDNLSQFSFFGQVKTNEVGIFDIGADGTVTTTSPHGFAVGIVVQLRRVYTGFGRRVGGAFVITDVGPLSTNFKIKNWTFGAAQGGSVFFESFALQQLLGCHVTRAGTRKVGRPSNEYRGRRSARKMALGA